MRILVLGGTGAMGVPIVNYFSEMADVYVTSRGEHKSSGTVHYLTGNAHSEDFLKESVLTRQYDAVIDFMSYSTDEFRNSIDRLLAVTDHYVFLSSGRVYADKQGLLNEKDQRILDVCQDAEYLSTDEYALAKARCENILTEKNTKNWTIVRPYITYNAQRLQLGVYEKEHWLRRYLNNHTIVIPRDIMKQQTTLTYGYDVAYRIAKLSVSEKTLGQVYNVSGSESLSWEEIFEIYDNCLFGITGKRMKVHYVEDSSDLQKNWNKYQIIYDRLYSRQFDNSKQEAICGTSYSGIRETIPICLEECLKNPMFSPHKIFGAYEGWSDRVVRELSSVKDIPGKKNKLKYIHRRFFM